MTSKEKFTLSADEKQHLSGIWHFVVCGPRLFIEARQISGQGFSFVA
jgi:hypothetical protein